MTIVAIITVRRAAIESFRRFEHEAARIMSRYGGAIDRSIVVEVDSEILKEIHIVTFPDANAFEAYRQDEEIAKMAHLRNESVVGTEIYVGEEGPGY